MSHALETARNEQGELVAAFVSAREAPWHRLGTVTDGALTAEDALKKAHMANWGLRHSPFVGYVEDEYVKRADRSFVVRTNPFTNLPDILGVTSPKYGIVGNEESFAFLDAFGQIGGAKFETAGSIEDGRRVFVTMRLPQELLVAGMDPVETYVLATTTHDGSAPFEGMIVPNRVVCRNTLDLAMEGALRKIRIRHTSNAVERMEQATQLLAATEGYVTRFKEAVERLAAINLDQGDVDDLLEQLFKTPPQATERVKAKVEDRRTEVAALLLRSDTIQDEFRRTGWGFVNAAAEWSDWFAPVRSDEPDVRRAVRGTFEDAGSLFKSRAAALVLA